MAPSTVYAQYEQVWAFGKNAGLDFTSGSPVPVTTAIDGFGEANASVCDANGRLLFYTEGTVVWDRNGLVMPGGANIVPLTTTNGFTPTSSSCQGTVIVPIPENGSRYYVFSLTSIELLNNAGRLYYSMVDMDLNGGLGDLVPGQVGILLDSNLAGETMTAVTGDRCNVWVLVRSSTTNKIKAFSISAAGIDPVSQQSSGGSVYNRLSGGQMAASPNGRRIVSCNSSVGGVGRLELYDFDRSTGLVYNFTDLDDSRGSYYGAAFSPDQSKLYVTGTGGLYQFDLAAPNPGSTKMLISSNAVAQLKLGPDGKIYCISSNPAFLSVIHSPDLPGAACQFDANAIALGNTTHMGLPNAVAVVKPDTATPVRTTLKTPCWVGASDGFALQANPAGWDVSWDNSSTDLNRVVHAPGTYWVRYKTAPCIHRTDTFHVTFQQSLPQAGFINGCKNDSGTNSAWVLPETGDNTVYTYTWSGGGQQLRRVSHPGADTLQSISPGTYTVRIQAANDCDTSLEVVVTPPTYQALFTADTAICQSDSLRLINTSLGDFTSWTWSFGDGDTASTMHAVHRYDKPGRYLVTLTGATGYRCYDTIQKLVVVDTLPVIGFSLTGDHLCTGRPVTFDPYYTTGITDLSWDYGDGAVRNLTTRHQYSFATSGFHTVTIKGSYPHCPDTSFSDTLYVHPFPVVNLGADTALCPNGEPLVLYNMQEGVAGHSYEWSTGETTGSIAVNQPGNYYLTVTANGCSTTDSVLIRNDCYLAIPNVFTPNGDGVNDYFFPREVLSGGVVRFRMHIYNRWGMLIFQTSELSGRGWDGRYNGEAMPDGVYVYQIEVAYKNNTKANYQGNVSLLR